MVRVEEITTMATVSAFNWTEEMKERFRIQLSEASFKNRVPVVLYLSLISVLGAVGNVLVILVYWLKFKPSATRTFVVAIAICDLITSDFGLPLQIVTIRYAYDSDYWTCRGFFFFATLSTQASGLILIIVAVDRFRRICYPLKKQLNQRNALLLTAAAVAVSVAAFAPLVPMYGMHRVDTAIPGVRGRMCWTDDEYLESAYGLVFKILLYVIFFVGLVVMATAYTMIGIRIWNQTRKKQSGQHGQGRNTCNEVAQMMINSGTHGIMYTAETSTVSCEIESERRIKGDAFDRPPTDTGHSEREGQSDEEARDDNEEPRATTGEGSSDSEQEETDLQDDPAKVPDAGVFITPKNRLGLTKEAASDTPSHGQSNDRPDENVAHDEPSNDPDDDARKKPSTAASQKELTSSGTHARQLQKPGTVAPELPKRKRITSRSRRIRSKTTLMMFVVTVFYVVNWLPHLVMRSVRSDPVNSCPDFIDCGWNTYAIVIRSYYINSAVNAFAYVFCNEHFRLKCKQLFASAGRRLACWRRE